MTNWYQSDGFSSRASGECSERRFYSSRASGYMLKGGIGVNLEIRDRVASMSSGEVIEGVIDGPKSSRRLNMIERLAEFLDPLSFINCAYEKLWSPIAQI